MEIKAYTRLFLIISLLFAYNQQIITLFKFRMFHMLNLRGCGGTRVRGYEYRLAISDSKTDLAPTASKRLTSAPTYTRHRSKQSLRK